MAYIDAKIRLKRYLYDDDDDDNDDDDDDDAADDDYDDESWIFCQINKVLPTY
jgi:hypothetical protein